jgi:hypothetical protein
MTTQPTNITKRTMMDGVTGEDKRYLVLIYHHNAVFMKSSLITKDASVVGKFVDNLSKAFLPNIIKYDEIVPLLLLSASINGVNFDTNISSLEIMVASQARYAKDISISYRKYLKTATNPKQSDLKFIKLTDIPYVTSSFSSIAFQNFDYSVSTSIARKRRGEKNEESDIEKILKY